MENSFSSSTTGPSSFATVDEMKSLFGKLRASNDTKLEEMTAAHNRKIAQLNQDTNERFLNVELRHKKTIEKLEGKIQALATELQVKEDINQKLQCDNISLQKQVDALTDVEANLERLKTQSEEMQKQFEEIKCRLESLNSFNLKVLTEKLNRIDPKEEQQILEDSIKMLNECPAAVQHLVKVALKEKPELIEDLLAKNPEAMTRIGEKLMEKNPTEAKKMIKNMYEREPEKGSNWWGKALGFIGALAGVIGLICLL